MSLNIHNNIKDKLQFFLSVSKIPNIIFHGPSGSGKRTIVNDFMQQIYPTKQLIKKNVFSVNCAHGKGIKFIREELKFFAKCHIHSNKGNKFKSIILSNADKLTIDAQSALRRVIELFSHTTRFFIIVENKYSLLKPILSRFCEIYVPQPLIDKTVINLHNINVTKVYNDQTNIAKKKVWLKNKLLMISKTHNLNVPDLTEFSTLLYQNGYSGLDILMLLEDNLFLKMNMDVVKRYSLLIHFNKIKKEFRNEPLLILFILNFIFLCSEARLENIAFM